MVFFCSIMFYLVQSFWNSGNFLSKFKLKQKARHLDYFSLLTLMRQPNDLVV